MTTIQVKVEQGMLRGEVKNECAIFRGVPYAEPPIGDKRFQSPQPKKGWDDVRDATSFSNQCPQREISDGFYGKEFYNDLNYPLPMNDEDCLYLNIWAPEKKSPTGYPVAIYYHGGSFDHGFSSEMEFDGMGYASRDTILVTVNYRIGLFGFLALEELAREDMNHSSGNYGILDQIQALKWVRKNIAAFGGNPDNITLIGQSVGAVSVQTLISSPLTRGMVKGAIMQSGGGLNNNFYRSISRERAYEIGKKVQELLGVTYARELRNLPKEKFVDILPKLYEEVGAHPFGPVVDDFVLEERLDEYVLNNHIHNIPCIIGSNKNDLYTEDLEDKTKGPLYQGCKDFALERNKHNGQPVYMYYFTRQLPGDDAGAFHSAELWYMFGTYERSWRPMDGRRDYVLSRTMLDEWTTFMKYQKPMTGWQPYDDKNEFVRRFI